MHLLSNTSLHMHKSHYVEDTGQHFAKKEGFGDSETLTAVSGLFIFDIHL